MSTKFFINSGENTLINKFDGIFRHTSVNYFDALVGYFRSSGYFQIRKYLKDVDQIRILVGINVVHLISESARKGLEFNVELRDYDDVVFAGETFESLWKESIDILPTEIEAEQKDIILKTFNRITEKKNLLRNQIILMKIELKQLLNPILSV